MTTSPQTLQLVDSIEYIESNCFQHQLLKALRSTGNVKTVPVQITALETRGHNPIICCLKQRTLFNKLDMLANLIGQAPVVIYDQDPWHAYMDDSDYKGVYQRAVKALNIKAIAVTTRWWAQRIQADGFPGVFTSMWVLPEYCDRGLAYVDRPVNVGFIGSLHPHRRKLFEQLEDMDIPVNVMGGNGLPYSQYLQSLGNLRVFIHSEDFPLSIDGQEANLKDALWIKDVEAAARGCFTIRNRGVDSDSYYAGLETVRLYDDVREIPELLRAIENMDPIERQSSIDRTVEYIREADKWQETARTLVALGSQTA